MEQTDSRVRAVIGFAWGYHTALCEAFEHSMALVDSGGALIASTATSVRVRLWEIFVPLDYNENLEGIGLSAHLDYAEHILEFEWPNEKDCENLTDSSSSCNHSPFDDGTDLSWDDPRCSDDSIHAALDEVVYHVDQSEMGDDLLERWVSIEQVDWSKYPKRLQPFLSRCMAEANR